MKNSVAGIITIIIGILFILVPLYILPVCDLVEHANGKITIMRCFWTARAEVGIGAVVIAIGILSLLISSSAVRIGFYLSLFCLSFLAAAIPTLLIGVCPNEMMDCHMGTLPALIILSITLMLVSVINIINAYRLFKRQS